jgi:hypothetical protein
MSSRTLTPQGCRTPEKVEIFQKSNLSLRILLIQLFDFRKAQRTNHSDAFAFTNYLACIGAFITKAPRRKAAVFLHLTVHSTTQCAR